MFSKRTLPAMGLAFGAGVATALLTVAAMSAGRTEVFEPEAPAEVAVASWLHVGCIQLGNDCRDVFQDQNGNLWVCKECFTTGNPSPGKCRRLTAYEIATALWCA